MDDAGNDDDNVNDHVVHSSYDNDSGSCDD